MDIMACVWADECPRMRFWIQMTSYPLGRCCTVALLIGGGHCLPRLSSGQWVPQHYAGPMAPGQQANLGTFLWSSLQ